MILHTKTSNKLFSKQLLNCMRISNWERKAKLLKKRSTRSRAVKQVFYNTKSPAVRYLLIFVLDSRVISTLLSSVGYTVPDPYSWGNTERKSGTSQGLT